ncbi:MAG TPA: AMP-binding protein, partial [Burkholderiales bacterium]|nr:AMP-binding protein [Burkholderiales bacterium]
MPTLLHELILQSASSTPAATALVYQKEEVSYEGLAERTQAAARGFLALGLARGGRVAIYLEKRFETVVASFAAACAGGAFVPVNPILKPDQVAYILRDCNVHILLTSAERMKVLAPALADCQDLRAILLVGDAQSAPQLPGKTVLAWNEASIASSTSLPHRIVDVDMAAILYTSGSTGKPKGVVLSHRNMVAGALSVAQYLQNHREDRILSALPLSFDAGFSQLTTAFSVGARVVLINYLLPRDIVSACDREAITGLTAVPPLWIQLAQLRWPDTVRDTLRYIANTGGRMPKATLDLLRAALPKTLPYLMYGLT